MQSWQSAPVIGQQPAAQPTAQPVEQQQPRRIFGAPEAPKQPTPPAPKDIFRDLTPAEVKQRGLAEGGVYQVNALGEIKIVQPPPKGGGPASLAVGRERLARIRTSLDNLRNLQGLVSGSDMGTGSIVGQESFRAGEDYAGLSSFFNQRANDVAGSIEMVQGDLINQVRQEMEQSGTPIGVKGADTEKEASRLAASIANLAQTQDEGEFLTGVGRAREYYIRRLVSTVQAMQEAGEDITPQQVLSDFLQQGATKAELKEIGSAFGLNLNEEQLDANLRSRDQGGPVSTFTPPEGPGGGPSGGGLPEVLGTSLVNTAVGYGQGASEALVDFPLGVASSVQTGANAVLDTVIGGGLDALGFSGAADAWRRTGQIEEARRAALANPVARTVNALAPPPAGYETQRDMARFAGGFLVPGPKGAKAPISAPRAVAQQSAGRGVLSDAPEIIAQGQRRNVPVLTTDIAPPQSGMGRFVKQTLPEKIPITGMSGPRAEQQAARVEAVNDLVREFGGTVGRELFSGGPGAVEDIAKSLTAERSRRLGVLTSAKNNVINGIKAPFDAAPNTVKAISEQVRALKEIDAVEFAPVIDRLQRFGEQLTSGKSLATVEEQRKLLGALFDDPNLAKIKDRGQKAINAIYDPLRKDMGNFIETQAGAGARNRWAKANEELSSMAGELKSTRFRNVLRDADVTPEAVSRILFSDTSNVTDMQRLVSNLPPQGKTKVKAALIQRAFDDASGPEGASVERFVGNIERLSGKIGVAFDDREKLAIEGFRRLMNATRRASAAGANIRTGEQNMPAIMGIGATQVLGAAGGVSTLGVGGLLARLYESPVVRDRLVKLASVKKGTPQEGRALQVIMRSAAPIVTQWREAAPKALNDNTAGALAAEEQQPNERQ